VSGVPYIGHIENKSISTDVAAAHDVNVGVTRAQCGEALDSRAHAEDSADSANTHLAGVNFAEKRVNW
jgi:hypothetical protein